MKHDDSKHRCAHCTSRFHGPEPANKLWAKQPAAYVVNGLGSGNACIPSLHSWYEYHSPKPKATVITMQTVLVP